MRKGVDFFCGCLSGIYFYVALFLQFYGTIDAQNIVYKNENNNHNIVFFSLELDTINNKYTFEYNFELFHLCDTGVISYKKKRLILDTNSNSDTCKHIIKEYIRKSTDSIYYQLSYIDSDWIYVCYFIINKDTFQKLLIDTNIAVFEKPKKLKKVKIIIDGISNVIINRKDKSSNYFILSICKQKNNRHLAKFHKVKIGKLKENITLKIKKYFHKPIKMKIVT